tara:strand:- start:12 stop:203 length:192 start_codon:yes stop_codon:yes gene_type:complete
MINMPYITNDKVLITYLDNDKNTRCQEAIIIGRTFDENPKYDVRLLHNNYLITNVEMEMLELL